jgi:uncharacterized protein YyaL (SSP411 family)
MKKWHIYLLILVTGVLFSFKPKETELKWYDWNEGYPLAAKKGKLVLVDIYTNWCGWCKKMDNETYKDKEVMKTLEKNFVIVKLNPEKTDVTYKVDTLSLTGYQLLNVLTNGQRTGFPTIVILNPKQNQVIHAEAGYQDAAAFKQTIEKVLANKDGRGK